MAGSTRRPASISLGYLVEFATRAVTLSPEAFVLLLLSRKMISVINEDALYGRCSLIHSRTVDYPPKLFVRGKYL